MPRTGQMDLWSQRLQRGFMEQLQGRLRFHQRNRDGPVAAELRVRADAHAKAQPLRQHTVEPGAHDLGGFPGIEADQGNVQRPAGPGEDQAGLDGNDKGNKDVGTHASG